MKKKIAGFILIVASLMLSAACKNIGSQAQVETKEPETSERLEIEWIDPEVKIEWIDPGIDYQSVRFESAGESLYLLEVTLDDNSTKYGFIDETGVRIIPVIYDHANVFSDGLSYVELDDRKFFIDRSGKETLDVSEYFMASSFSFGFSVVTRIHSEDIESGFRQSFLQGIMDQSGNEVLPCEYTESGCFENGTIWAVKDGKYAIFDHLGNRITQHEYSYIAYAGENKIIAEKNGKMGYLDQNGEAVIPFEYDEAGGFFDGLAAVSNEGQKSYINVLGEKITQLAFEQAEAFSEERGLVMMGGYFGYIDTQGNLVIPCVYDEAYHFNGGVAVVIENLGRMQRFTPIDQNGEIAITPTEMGYYKWNDTYIAFYDPELGEYEVDLDVLALLDSSGNRLTGFYYSDIFDFHEGLAVAEEFGGFALFYGLLNQYGAEIIPVMYEKVEIVDKNTCIVQLFVLDPDSGSGGGNSKVGIATLPHDSATRKP